MRHNVQKSKLGRSSAHRNAMLRNMVTSLLEYERIETTLAKAKELRRVADRMITLAKKGDLAARRQALKVIRKKDVAHKLFDQQVLLFSGRAGGYTRILKLGNRPGDNAEMAIIELVAKSVKKEEKKPAAKGEKKSALQTAREAVKPGAKPARKSSPRKKAAGKEEAAPKKGKSKKSAAEAGK